MEQRATIEEVRVTFRNERTGHEAELVIPFDTEKPPNAILGMLRIWRTPHMYTYTPGRDAERQRYVRHVKRIHEPEEWLRKFLAYAVSGGYEAKTGYDAEELGELRGMSVKYAIARLKGDSRNEIGAMLRQFYYDRWLRMEKPQEERDRLLWEARERYEEDGRQYLEHGGAEPKWEDYEKEALDKHYRNFYDMVHKRGTHMMRWIRSGVRLHGNDIANVFWF